MKIGYRICIQKSLTGKQKEVATQYIDEFIKTTAEHNGRYDKAYNTRGGWKSYFKRGTLGFSPKELDDVGLTLRRISKGSRIFGVQTLDSLLMDRDDENIRCMCPQHRGSVRVTSKLSPNDFHIVHEVGEIKG